MPNVHKPHPLDHEPAVRAVFQAASPVAALEHAMQASELVRGLVIAGSELVRGFDAPAESVERRSAHRRAWIAVRELDREVLAARIGRRAPAAVVARAQRAIDRADVMIAALPGVLPT